MRYRYLHLDVFTDRALEGNQLAVFPVAAGLDAATMQRIAREMAFSETTFVLPREDGATDARMRIFTPGAEVPMAGHPTIGSTFALAHEGVIEAGRERFTFGLGVGPTPVELQWREGRLAFVWMTQQRPAFGPEWLDRGAVAAALGLAEDGLAFGLPVQAVTCGLEFLLVPLRSRADVDRAAYDAVRYRAACSAAGSTELPVFVFSTERAPDGATAYSRMFAPMFGVFEDPATGSASGPLGAYLVRHGIVSGDPAHRIVSLQGVAMGRPSRIHVDIDGTAGDITRVRVGGTAVLVAEGELRLEAAPR
jgi:trans-2,3-dihydro-3-hydroxyanthranilate isomerase